MNQSEIKQRIIAAVQKAGSQAVLREEILANQGEKADRHEFLFFIKPEITLGNSGINLKGILDLLFEALLRYQLTIKNISLLGASYLHQYNIIAQHYGVINALSREPLQHFTSDAMAKFRQVFGLAPEEANVLGSLGFLQRFSGHTPQSLDQLWQQSKTEKLASGNYCARVEKDGEVIYLINGFHPRQLIHFTEKGRSIIAFTLTGNLDWALARNQFIGKTNPADALPGSLRNELLRNQSVFGLDSVSASQNGFHLSAGPVEGLVELIRYCSDLTTGKRKTYNDFVFGRTLLKHFDDRVIDMICDNHPVSYNGKITGTFDLTEEKNSDQAL
ncbi:MAG: hypothetical protein JXQ80_09015, partial [Bacteroidales bacterium]|nr:hypothetical protein [Bacteroidales bacterium]